MTGVMPPRPKTDLLVLPPLDDEARAESIARTFAGERADQPVWLFAYGSLLWRPCFSFTDQRAAKLDGYRRAFNFWTVRARGTPERPGLGMGLEPGGSCHGVAYRLADETRRGDLEAIWAREMYSGIYAPKWLTLTSPDGSLTALTFVIDRDHPQYASGLNTEQTARVVAGAEGSLGSCRDYLAQTVEALSRHGITDPDLAELLAAVDAIRKNRRPPTE